MELENKSNNELMGMQLEFEAIHNTIKQEIIVKLDELDSVEKKYGKIIEILKNRVG